MLDSLDPEENDALEGLLVAAALGDEEAYARARAIWDSLDINHKVGGVPRRCTMEGVCGHCGCMWSAKGVSFNPGFAQAIMVQQAHMVVCEQQEACNCFITNVAGEILERCQRCERADAICECDKGPTYGPCGKVEATTEFLD